MNSNSLIKNRKQIVSSKIIIIMKTCLILLFCGIMQAFASTSYSQEATLSLNLKNKSIETVLNQIEEQTEFRFLYNKKQVNVDRIVNIEVRDKTIQNILNELFDGENVSYSIRDRQIVLSKQSVPQQSSKQITGVITDKSGEPIIGANVSVKGTTNGTISDLDGKYSLNVDNTSVLLISYIGYDSQEIAVGNKTVINVTLAENTLSLDEVVVVGYGTLSKRSVSTAISSIKSESIEKVPAANASQALVGQISGVRFQQASGDPGSAGIVRIRGNGSITSGSGPLYVIDGYPTTDANLFNSLAPTDIESIDILKDAASAAIYGSRAGNGVIMVTTKRGQEGKTSFFANVSYGLQTVQKKIDLLNAEEYVEIAKEALTNQGESIPEIFNTPSKWANIDWQDVIFRTAPMQNYQIGATGGSQKVRYAISGGYTGQDGILVNSYMNRFNMKMNLDAEISKHISVGISVLPSYTKSRKQSPQGPNTSTSVSSGVLAEALSMPPILPVYFPNGDYYSIAQDAENRGAFNEQLGNPLNKLDAYSDKYETFNQVANFHVAVTPIERLVLKSAINTSIYQDSRDMYTEAFFSRGGDGSGNISTPNLAVIDAERNTKKRITWYWSNTATYSFSLGEDHNFDALLGYDVSQQQYFAVTLQPRTDKDTPVAFENTIVKNVQGAILTKGSSSKTEYVSDAVFGRLNYNYKGKYMLAASVRRDRSSRFGPQNRAGVFPSISGGWMISEESFLNDNSVISSLKLRASYGETGNDQLGGDYPWIKALAKSYYNFGAVDARVLAYNPGGFTNNNLGWEKNKQIDLGIDMGFFNNRIGFLLDIYKRNSNTILSAVIPNINGRATSVMMNTGDVENKGLEITLNSKNLTGKFQWTTDFNISFNRNKIVKLAPGQNKLSDLTGGTFWANTIRNYVGRPMGDIYMYIVEGTFNNEDDLNKYAKMGTQAVGDLRFRDVSGPEGIPDGKITADDLSLVGNYQPDFTFGITNSFTYNNFEFRLLLDGSYGNEVVNALERPISLARSLENSSKGVLNRWKSESDPGDGYTHKAGTSNLGNNVNGNTRYLYDGSFLRIRNIYLGYTLSNEFARKLGLTSCRLFGTVENLHTFTEYTGYNPEANYSGDSSTNNGVDQGTYPLARTYSIGLNLTF